MKLKLALLVSHMHVWGKTHKKNSKKIKDLEVRTTSDAVFELREQENGSSW